MIGRLQNNGCMQLPGHICLCVSVLLHYLSAKLLDYSFFQPGYVGLGYSQEISYLLLSLFYPTYGVYSIPQFYDGAFLFTEL